MAKRVKAIYKPGELDEVRKKLGDIDPDEARRMAQVLGGEVGIEKTSLPPETVKKPRHRHETVEVSLDRPGLKKTAPTHRVEIRPQEGERPKKIKRTTILDPGDDLSVPLKPSYRERLKMDRYAAQVEFEIKNPTQVLYSMLSIFGEPPDFVNPDFVSRRMNEYYQRIETLVTITRSLLPRNHPQRNERFKKMDPFGFAAIDAIRYWNIEKITSDLGKIQAHPRNAKVSDFADIIKAIYRPLFVLEKIDPETDLHRSYKNLLSLVQSENPTEAKEKHQDSVRLAVGAYMVIKKSVRFLLYPLFLKLVSDRWFSYEEFFTARRHRIMAFLGVSESDRVLPAPVDSVPVSSASEPKKEAPKRETEMASENTEDIREEPVATEKVETRDGTQTIVDRALTRGLATLENLFPQAGWNKLGHFPDLYPYFFDVFDLKRGYELIAPQDPMLQVSILTHILEELFYGLRYVSFGTMPKGENEAERIDEGMNSIISSWHDFIERILEKEYLPRLAEYCRVIDGSPEARLSTYAKRIQMELLWIKRLYFLPFFKFESVSAPPFRKQDISPLYTEVRKLRRLLTAVAAGIERGSKLGGAEKKAPCDGIDNPWEPYIFQVPNPLSIRMDALLGGKNSKQKTNAALVYHTLAVVVVLDNLVNNENSWAYSDMDVPLFRSLNGEGQKPIFGVDEKIDTRTIFKQALQNKNKDGPFKS